MKHSSRLFVILGSQHRHAMVNIAAASSVSRGSQATWSGSLVVTSLPSLLLICGQVSDLYIPSA
ncbi:hypothetical protein E1B28_006751 [Marasmius oreades]|uniref:Uncharacterized protein n=1 Tax=Marasmius oreades TaxID=181124 RepID=A0A9P8AA01_9AGAR|nr:uncharacterized protein E1B28_006751 [Marasmius oreades]KAG7096071.1 hypothetical protein E1B28_006751 [Marasmius oreades]